MNYSNFFIKLYLFFMLVGGLNAVGTRTRIAYINKEDNTIRYYDGEVSSANCSNLKWIDITGGFPAKDIAIASDGQMLAISTNNGLCYSRGVVNGVANWIRQGSFDFVNAIAAAGNNKFLYVGKGDAAFGHGNDYKALHYCFTAPSNDGQLAWKSFKDFTAAGPIAINSKGQFIHASGVIFYQSGKIGPNGEVSGTSDSWQAHPGTDAKSVAAANGLFMHSTPSNLMYYIKADSLDGKSASDWVRLTNGSTLKIAVSDSGQLISMGSGQLFYADRINDNSTADWVVLLNGGANINAISIAISSISDDTVSSKDFFTQTKEKFAQYLIGQSATINTLADITDAQIAAKLNFSDFGLNIGSPLGDAIIYFSATQPTADQSKLNELTTFDDRIKMLSLRIYLATYFGASSTIATLADITAAQISAKIAEKTLAVVKSAVDAQIGHLTSSEITTFKARIVDPDSINQNAMAALRTALATYFVAPSTIATLADITAAQITAKIAANTFTVVNDYVNSQIGTLTSSEITTFKARIIDPGSSPDVMVALRTALAAYFGARARSVDTLADITAAQITAKITANTFTAVNNYVNSQIGTLTSSEITTFKARIIDPGSSSPDAMVALRAALATYFGAPSTIATLADITAAQITAKIAANTFTVVKSYVDAQIGSRTSSEITNFKARIVDTGSSGGRGGRGGRGTNVGGTNVGGTNVGGQRRGGGRSRSTAGGRNTAAVR